MYVLIAVGATVAAAPTAIFMPEVHFVAAAFIGVVLLGVAVAAWRFDEPFRVRMALLVVVCLYPIQAATGILVATGITLVGGSAHLFGAMLLFAVLLVSLVWSLDHAHPHHQPAAVTRLPESQSSSEPSDSTPAPSAGPRATGSVWARVRAIGGAYLRLTKPRLMWLLCLLALAGMGLAAASGVELTGVTVVATLGGGVLAIGASGTFNHVYERDRDRRMRRTADRPVVTGQVSPIRATMFGLGLAIGSFTVMVVFVNRVAAVLTMLAVAYYVVAYTVILKPNTVWNIAIGGGAGAFPAVIGWSAVTGGLGLPALVLAAVVVAWTPAHFYNLAIAYREDYANAAYPVLPVVRGIAVTRRRIMYSLGMTMLLAVGLALVVDLGLVYAVGIAGLGGVFLWSVARQFGADDPRVAVRSFHASNAYLGVLLAAVVLETLVF